MEKKLSELQKKDLKYIFHPCSQMKDYEDLPPIVIKSGEGVYLTDENGKKYIDCISSWWVNLFGHSNPRINKALINQANKLEHVIFANFTHEAAIELGERLVKVSPKGLNKIFFGDNGSSAIEIALKLSFQYHQQSGNKDKKKFISLSNGYHGETLGALGVTDVDLFTNTYKPLIKESIKIEGPTCSNCKYNENFQSCSAQCFEIMEKAIEGNHNEIAAVIIEPMVQGAAGMNMYSANYLKKLRKITEKYNVHFIADEIAMGFGRTGKMFAVDHAGISPDLMCIGKGLTAGYLPMSIVMMTDKIYDNFYSDYLLGKSFLHSHSYSGNALGCAVAVETLKIFEDENILEIVNEKGEYLKKKMFEIFGNHEQIKSCRQIGLIGAMELRNENLEGKLDGKSLKNYSKRVGYEIYKIGLTKGIILRPLGNVIYFMPPYIITKDEIDSVLNKCKESIDEYYGTIYKENTKIEIDEHFIPFEV